MNSTNRRDFLKGALGASTLVSMLPAMPEFLCRAAQAAGAKPGGETILVVLQLAGGNDGLNTVVPYADDHYARARNTLRLTAKDVLRIDDLLGFHPGMPGFARLLKEGRLTVVQGVGTGGSSQSHPVAMHAWQTARPKDPNAPTGWLGAAADTLSAVGRTDLPAVFLGQINRPFAVTARTSIVPTIRTLEDCTLHATAADPQRGLRAVELPRAADAGSLLEDVQRTAAATYVSSRKIREVMGPAPAAEYPPLPLAASLRDVARLIRAELGIRIYFTELGGQEPGGFDNHAGQRDNHASLLRQLSQSVGAFVDDLRRDGLLDRVLLMTFSEFGRTVAENGRRGTDHGAGAPMFLAGGRLRGGLLGPHPDLSDTEQGGVRHHTDFRRVYATVLDRWLGLDSRAILGSSFESLDLVKG